jgi:hypothetical protein
MLALSQRLRAQKLSREVRPAIHAQPLWIAGDQDRDPIVTRE